MKRILMVLLLFIFLSSNTVLARSMPIKIDGMFENDYILNEMLPNPNVYLYGVDSNGFPVLLMNFSATVPVFTINDNVIMKPFRFLARYVPLFRKRTSNLGFLSLNLKLEPSKDSPEGKNFYYKIAKIKCQEIVQVVGYQDQNKITARAEPKFNEQSYGYLQDEFTRMAKYNTERPIITYSGIGSDTLKIMLKKGRKYRIPSGHIDVSMLVIAVPYYDPPITYCDLMNPCNTCNYLKDFMDQIEPCPCKHKVRKINFSKRYYDNSMLNYYEVTKDNNKHELIMDSEVMMGSRIHKVASTITTTKTTKTSTVPLCSHDCCINTFTGNYEEKPKSQPSASDKAAADAKMAMIKASTSAANAAKAAANAAVKAAKKNNIWVAIKAAKIAANAAKAASSVSSAVSPSSSGASSGSSDSSNNVVEVVEETKELKSPLLKDSDFMYDDIINIQELNPKPQKTEFATFEPAS